MSRRAISWKFGPRITSEGVHFRLWAPKASGLGVKINGAPEPSPMRRAANGWYDLEVEGATAGTFYQFVLADGLHVPDPAARFQPRDVHGPSEVIDPSGYNWRNPEWRGRPWAECVLYELHVGAFTPEGTFRAAAERLEYLAGLGITAIELMPLADFPGGRNWGYDGVLPFAPDSIYGRPEDLKFLIDSAHALGIMVFLDVVYNHFGPDGNYLPAYAPIFTEKHSTPWGAAVNYDADGSKMVREFIIENALYWISEYRFDGLRLDAVHAIMDDSKPHILEELAARVLEAAGDRHVHLLLENEENSASRLLRGGDGRPLQFTAQWNDDVHHVLHTAASGENAGYYAEYAGKTELLGRCLAEGFAFQGEMMAYRGHPRGEPSADLPPLAFVAFIQNHDQVGNRAFGDRITSFAPPEAVRAIAAVYLLSPQIPMLFMGEEWGAAQPFPFFCDFGPDLAEAVRNGRRNEFSRFPEFQDPGRRDLIPDPGAASTFQSAKLRWEDQSRGEHEEWLNLYKRLLAVRRSEIIPHLETMRGSSGRFEVLDDMAVRVRWLLGDASELVLTANLKGSPAAQVTHLGGRMLWRDGDSDASSFGPWAVTWTKVDEGKSLERQ